MSTDFLLAARTRKPKPRSRLGEPSPAALLSIPDGHRTASPPRKARICRTPGRNLALLRPIGEANEAGVTSRFLILVPPESQIALTFNAARGSHRKAAHQHATLPLCRSNKLVADGGVGRAALPTTATAFGKAGWPSQPQTGEPTMKASQASILSIILSAVLCGICLVPQTAFCQGGSLTPPGTPAPTMKSLDQIEPRTPITNTTAVTISASGSYYLTANISITNGSAITITASQVTLDLNGFTLSSTEASPTGTGILLVGGNTDITILNGHIKGGVTYHGGGSYSGPGFAAGIYYSVTAPYNVRVSGVSVSGCSTYGIYLSVGNATIVESCPVFDIGSYGIEADSVSQSAASQCGSVAIAANIASDCNGFRTGR